MVELGYADNTDSMGVAASSTSGVAIPNLVYELPPTTRPIVVVYGGFAWNSQAGSQAAFVLKEGGVEIGRAPATSATANAGVVLRGWRRRDASNDTREYEVWLVAPTGGTTTATGNGLDPLVLHILQV